MNRAAQRRAGEGNGEIVTEEYRVQLDVFSGPLDLLLYLIRRDEVDIQDISITRVADQFCEYVRVLERVDPNAAGEFLVMAATLAELKSRALLPTPPLEAVEGQEDPRAALVTQLLEYKRFKDAARALGRAADDRAMKYVRRPAKLPRELDGMELSEASVWDLLRAFNKVMSSIGEGPRRHEVQYDETPIELIADEIVALIEQEGPTRFTALFDDVRERSVVIGRFLAILELMKQRRVRCEQAGSFDEIYIFLLDAAPATDDDGDAADGAEMLEDAADATDVVAQASAGIESQADEADAVQTEPDELRAIEAERE